MLLYFYQSVFRANRLAMQLGFALLFLGASCFSCASQLDNSLIDHGPINPKLWSNFTNKESQPMPAHNEIGGKSVKYSQSIQKYLAVDAYMYTNKRDNTFRWIVDVVSDLFKIRYYTDQSKRNDHLEVTSKYALNPTMHLQGHASHKQKGNTLYQDYSVGLAIKPTKNVEISAGYSDRKIKQSAAEGKLYLNIKGQF